MGALIPIHSRRTFTLEQAEGILPIVRRITDHAAAAARGLQEELRWVPREEPLYARRKSELDLIVRRWAVKIARLGCEPRGIWLVDFDAGEGWFSWRLGDESLSFFHRQEGAPALGPAARGDELLS